MRKIEKAIVHSKPGLICFIPSWNCKNNIFFLFLRYPRLSRNWVLSSPLCHLPIWFLPDHLPSLMLPCAHVPTALHLKSGRPHKWKPLDSSASTPHQRPASCPWAGSCLSHGAREFHLAENTWVVNPWLSTETSLLFCTPPSPKSLQAPALNCQASMVKSHLYSLSKF